MFYLHVRTIYINKIQILKKSDFCEQGSCNYSYYLAGQCSGHGVHFEKKDDENPNRDAKICCATFGYERSDGLVMYHTTFGTKITKVNFSRTAFWS